MRTVEIRVPDIGDFKDVEVIEVMVKEGEEITKDQSIILVESDKASMEIPSPEAGKIRDLKVKLGDRVSEGTILLALDVDDMSHTSARKQEENEFRNDGQTPVQPTVQQGNDTKNRIECDTLVLGAGPGGYTAAFRAADLGQKVVIVERYPVLGGVCLNVGCIPSKALLHAAKVITETEEMKAAGICFAGLEVNPAKLNQWKQEIVDKLTGGLAALAKARKIHVLTGNGMFTDPYNMEVTGQNENWSVRFKNAIIAAGSSATKLPGFPYGHPALVDSTGALDLKKIPEKMLVIGGGIIGLEMACVYDALGAKLTIAEFSDGLIPAADRDVVRPLVDRIKKRYEAVYTNTRVTKLEENGNRLTAIFEGESAPEKSRQYDLVLVAVGRRPNGKRIGAEKAGVQVNEQGFIPVNRQQQTNVPHIYAIGDICGEPMLAHKASYEGKIAAETIAGIKATEYDAMTVPSVAYTDPEIAWMGLTEDDAKKKGIPVEKSVFPWNASGRNLTSGRRDGLTKLLWDKSSKRLLGAAIVGTNAGELLSETTLALEMSADLEDIALTIHPHPTLSETIMFAAEAGLGTITDLYIPQKR